MTPFLILGATLDPKFKATIWVHQYTYLGSLVPLTEPQEQVLSFHQQPPMSMTQPQATSITTVGQWLPAFSMYTSVYMERYHTEAPSIFTYYYIMCRIIRVYDEQFRHIHTLVPSVPWHATKWKLAMDVVLGDMNWSVAHRPPQQTFWDYHPQSGSADSHFTPCHRWNSTGQCHFTNCHFKHTCRACRQWR